MANYQIITDATADFPLELAISMGIETIPMEIMIDDESFTYIPGDGDISVEEFYNRMRSGSITRTSQINHLVYTNTFEKFLAQGMDIIYICFSSALSATIQRAHVCAEQLLEKYPERKIYIIDSLCASVGEALFVYTAATKHQANLSIEELAAWLDDNKLKLCHWFTVDDLEYLRRGGRVSAVSAVIGTTLNIKPVLHVDDQGRLINVMKVRGRKKALSSMLEEMEKTFLPKMGKTVFIGHGSCMEDAEQLADLVKTKYPDLEISIYDIGPVIGAHSGPGTLALFFWGEKR